MRVTSYKDDVINRAKKAFQATVTQYDNTMKNIIESPRYWGDFGTTYRRSGEVVVGGFRNIVDLGNLRNSQTVTFFNPFLACFEWNGNGETPTVLVHEGYTTRTGKTIPARPWTIYGVLEGDLEKTFVNAFNF